MIPRYTTPAMRDVWSLENRFRKWLEVELAVCDVLADRGEIPRDAARTIRERADFSLDRILELEKEIRHDVVAFTTALAEAIGPESRFVHLGLTSTDVVDTAQALQVREASILIQEALERLQTVVGEQALRYRHTAMMGRTHGVHAEPTTLGLKLAVWYAELERNRTRFRRARTTLEVGKISGPVGTFSYLPPAVEEEVCRRLGIDFARASTQTLQRDRHAEYLGTLAILGSTYDKMATEIRHLQRTEVAEAGEPFYSGQKGSSSMPHKRNPVVCENVSGLARVLRGNAMVALENQPLWHERDISHSSAERVVLPDSTTLVHFLTGRLTRVLRHLRVDEQRMARNMELTGGLHFSGGVLLALVRKGVVREQAYAWVQRNAMKVWDEGADFQTLLEQDPDIGRTLGPDQIRSLFDLNEKLRHVDAVFERLFSDAGHKEKIG